MGWEQQKAEVQVSCDSGSHEINLVKNVTSGEPGILPPPHLGAQTFGNIAVI